MARPKSFDPETALACAMAVFQEKGYEAASVADLTERMGINRFSMYDTFGDKRSLYLAALDRYVDREVEKATAPLREPEATLEEGSLTAARERSSPRSGSSSAAGAGQQSQLHFRQAKYGFGGITANPVTTGQGHFQSATKRRPVDSRNGW